VRVCAGWQVIGEAAGFDRRLNFLSKSCKYGKNLHHIKIVARQRGFDLRCAREKGAAVGRELERAKHFEFISGRLHRQNQGKRRNRNPEADRKMSEGLITIFLHGIGF